MIEILSRDLSANFLAYCAERCKKPKQSYLKEKCMALLSLIAEDPYQTPPPYERLIGDYAGCISRRINLQHRLVYSIDNHKKLVRVYRMWTHYE